MADAARSKDQLLDALDEAETAISDAADAIAAGDIKGAKAILDTYFEDTSEEEVE